jgi:hypothetical protein
VLSKHKIKKNCLNFFGSQRQTKNKKERKKERNKNGALLEKQSKTKTNALFQHCERTY